MDEVGSRADAPLPRIILVVCDAWALVSNHQILLPIAIGPELELGPPMSERLPSN